MCIPCYCQAGVNSLASAGVEFEPCCHVPQGWDVNMEAFWGGGGAGDEVGVQGRGLCLEGRDR